ncbi:MAG TPA: hypothetical protein DIW52_22440 [Pseudomonas sp.]|jgi:hypothetical protein|nr:hypothetical protein [Pseudomonas sp.]
MTFLKNRFVTAISLAACALALSACSNSVPSCSDKKTTDLVTDIVKRELTKQLGAAVVNALKYNIVDIRTTDKNENTGAYKCAANVEMTGPVKTNTSPLWYTVEATDDGSFYVNVAEEEI